MVEPFTPDQNDKGRDVHEQSVCGPQAGAKAESAAPSRPESLLDRMYDHIDCCPFGWIAGEIVRPNSYTDADIIEWLSKLHRLAKEHKDAVERRI